MCYINTNVLFTKVFNAYLFMQYICKLKYICKEKLFCLHYTPGE